MAKYHINKHGVPAPCNAKDGNCPLGGISGNENHYDNLEDAEKAAQKLLERENDLLPEIPAEPFSKENIKAKFPHLSDEQVAHVESYVKKEEEMFNKVSALKARRDMDSDDYFDEVQRVRQEALKKYELSKGLPIDEEQTKELLEEKLPKPWGRSAGYQFHPELDEKSFSKVRYVMTAYSGKSKEEVTEGVKKIVDEKGVSLHEATRQYWNTLEQRKDKPFVSLDLETANPKFDKSLEYDNGQLTYIIEIGGIKTYPDGRTEEISVMYGIPKEFEDRHGTGFQETHNITPDDIRGKKEFTTDEENQKKIMDFLDGSVVIAHNAYFEEKQLTNSLRGFKAAMNKGNIETLDTMNFCKYLVRESKRNTNEAFVQAAGMEYEGAHRAHQDAKMTLNAFNALKDNRNEPIVIPKPEEKTT